MSWRKHCGPIIAEVIERVGREDMKKLRKALREAYPYGERRMWPYKVWCSEVRDQLKLKSKKVFETEMPLFDGRLMPGKVEK